MLLIPEKFKAEIAIRINKIKDELQKSAADAVLVAANPNIYYTSGRFFRGYVFISRQGNPLWFVIKPQVFDKEKDVWFIRKPEEITQILKDQGINHLSTIALEESDLSYSDIIRLKALFPDSELKNGSIILKNARKIKTDWEINEMKEDGLHQVKVYGEVKDCYRPGMSDLLLQIEIEKRLRLEGSLGVSRVSGNMMEINLGSVISGDNADNPSPYDFTMGGSGMHPALPVGSDNSVILEG